jgi:hypothetical protein
MRTKSLFVSLASTLALSVVASAASLSVQSATSYVMTSECLLECDALVEGPCALICDTQNEFVVEFATSNVAVTPISLTVSATADAITVGGKTMAHAMSGFNVDFSFDAPTFVYVEWNIFFPPAENNFLVPPLPADGVWVGELAAGSYFVKADHIVVGEGAKASGIFVRAIPDIAADCDGDGTADWQEIVAGTQLDTNNNGIPDACEIPGDLDHDGSVGAADLAILLGQWGGTGSADFDGDGDVGAADLAILLGLWT